MLSNLVCVMKGMILNLLRIFAISHKFLQTNSDLISSRYNVSISLKRWRNFQCELWCTIYLFWWRGILNNNLAFLCLDLFWLFCTWSVCDSTLSHLTCLISFILRVGASGLISILWRDWGVTLHQKIVSSYSMLQKKLPRRRVTKTVDILPHSLIGSTAVLWEPVP